MFIPLCEAWPLPPSGCPAITGSPEVTGIAVQAASDLLWELSGYRYGSCEVLLRPCRTRCRDGWWGSTGWWHDGGWPRAGGPLWLEAACGRCRLGCGCTDADSLQLPAVVQSVTEVMIDGVVLPSSAYHLFDGRLLVRADGGRWPLCQDWRVPVTGVGAWSVTMVAGEPVPPAGQLALGQLAAEYATWCSTGQCTMPAFTTSKTRQGVTQQFPTAAELRQLGLTGLALVDRWLSAVNPGGLRLGPAIWDPDDYAPAFRRPGGAG